VFWLEAHFENYRDFGYVFEEFSLYVSPNQKVIEAFEINARQSGH
jgi:hypothetical protein